MASQLVLVIGGVALLASWVVVVVRRYYLAPLALFAAGATYIFSFLAGLVLCFLSFGQVDPIDIANKVLKAVYVQSIVFTALFLATAGYIVYVVNLI